MAARPDLSASKQPLLGYWALLWLQFMQSVMLHRRLQATGIDPEAPVWRLWRRPEPGWEVRRA